MTLRPFSDADLDARVALGIDPEIRRMFGGHRTEIRTIAQVDAEAWLRSRRDHPHAWAIEFEDRFIGEIRLDNVGTTSVSMAIGLFDRELLGQGLGTEASRSVLAYAFEELGVERLSVRVLEYNHRAIRMYERLGFTLAQTIPEAALVDGDMYADLIMELSIADFRSTS